jgi:hypothetical protein
LRDAINVGVAALEELGDEPEGSIAPPRSRAEQPRAEEPPGEERNELAKEALPATRKQLNYLEALISDAVEDGLPKFEEMVGKPISELSRGEASEWIGRLSGRAA